MAPFWIEVVPKAYAKHRGTAQRKYRCAVGDVTIGPALFEWGTNLKASISDACAFRVESDFPQFLVSAVHQTDRHLLGLGVDIHETKELQPG